MNDEKTGGLIDPRPEIAKAQDWHDNEVGLASAFELEWKEIDLDTIQDPYPPSRYQYTSSSCMAHAGVTVLGIENAQEEDEFVELSANNVYRNRLNYSGEGMWLQNVLSLLCKPHACKEEQLPSQNMTEVQMNAEPKDLTEDQKQTADYYCAGGYVEMEIDIDKIAAIIAQKKGVELIMFFLSQEYWRNVPRIIEASLTNNRDDQRIQRHGIAAVGFGMYKGKKALVIKDSSGLKSSIKIDGDFSGLRVITEDFLNERCYGAGYLLPRKNQSETTPKPAHTFARSLVFGMMRDEDVIALQNILKYEGFFSLDVPSTGNMLQITCGALKKWQVAHGIMDFANEPDVRKVRFGPKSIALANSIYKK